MDVVTEQVYLNSYRRKRSKRRAIAVAVAFLTAVYGIERKTGVLALVWKSLSRGIAAAVAAWIEGAGGIPLFTLEGHEPPEADPATLFHKPPRSPPRSLPEKPQSAGSRSAPAVASTSATSSDAEVKSSDVQSTSSKELTKDLDVPQFLMSTKFFACLELADSRAVAEATLTITLEPHSLLFQAGDDGSSGIFVVVAGSVGMFLADGDTQTQTNTLRPGESVGDLDVIDGAKRSITCMALEEGAVLVQLSRAVFVSFLTQRPAALQIYLQQGIARLWRVAHFLIADYLNLPLPPGEEPPAPDYLSRQGAAGLGHLSDASQAVNVLNTPRGSLASRTDIQFAAGFGHLSDASNGVNVLNTPRVSHALRSDVQNAAGPLSQIDQPEALMMRSAPDTESQVAVSLDLSSVDRADGDAPQVTVKLTSTPVNAIDEPPRALRGGRSGDSRGTAAAQQAAQGPEAGPHRAASLDERLRLDPGPLSNNLGPPVYRRGHTFSSLPAPDLSQPAEIAGAAEAAILTGGLPPEDGIVYVEPAPGQTGTLRSLRDLALGERLATAATGWDCVSADEAQLQASTVAALQAGARTFVTTVLPNAPSSATCRIITLVPGSLLLQQGKASGQMMVLLEGHATLERAAAPNGATRQTAIARPASILGATALLCSTSTQETSVARTTCKVLAIGQSELQNLLNEQPAAYLDLLLAASKALGYFIRRFVSLGLNRVWLRSGGIAYEQGVAADSMFVIISGRVRLVSQRGDGSSGKALAPHVDEEVGRGETIGAVWAVTGGKHDTTAIAVRDSELVRLSRGAFEVISRSAPEAAARVLSDMANRMLSAHRSRTSKLDRAKSVSPAGVATRTRSTTELRAAATRPALTQRCDIVTIAIVPTSTEDAGGAAPRGLKPVRRLAMALRQSLLETGGTVLTLSWQTMHMLFPQSAERLLVPFYRTKITSWMADQEEDYRFILLEADPGDDKNWAKLCVEQADCILLVAGEDAAPDVTAAEYETVWQTLMPPPSERALWDGVGSPGNSSESLAPPVKASSSTLSSPEDVMLRMDTGDGAAFAASEDRQEGEPREGLRKYAWLRFIRRVELVLLHANNCTSPTGTLEWLLLRPLLTRHHHVRLSERKDVARLRRWVSGHAVGLVLSGGGSRGLAHLGVLQALENQGVPVDVVGGTSQGAFMAALYAQGLPPERLLAQVRNYAAQMSSPRHLLSDVTLPLLSLFSGRQFDKVLQETFSHGPQNIEELWLPYFCVSTNLSKAQAQVHQLGPVWQLVRASMTIVGMLPPVIREGEMLVDGGYVNNMPVDIMHGLGVHRVIVVDVEDRQSGVWHNLTPIDGGLSGWRLLWDRVCPIPSWRSSPSKTQRSVPRYRELVNALSWIAHSQNLHRMYEDYRIDLYLRPPHIWEYRLMDWHLIDRIVRGSYRYAWAAISEWLDGLDEKGVGLQRQPSGKAGHGSALLRSHSGSHAPRVGRSELALANAKRWRSTACMTDAGGNADAAGAKQRERESATNAWLVSIPHHRQSTEIHSGARKHSIDGNSPLPPVPVNTHPVSAGKRNVSTDSVASENGGVVPTPGDAVRFTQSELMRNAARGPKQEPPVPQAPLNVGLGMSSGAAKAKSLPGGQGRDAIPVFDLPSTRPQTAEPVLQKGTERFSGTRAGPTPEQPRHWGSNKKKVPLGWTAELDLRGGASFPEMALPPDMTTERRTSDGNIRDESLSPFVGGVWGDAGQDADVLGMQSRAQRKSNLRGRGFSDHDLQSVLTDVLEQGGGSAKSAQPLPPPAQSVSSRRSKAKKLSLTTINEAAAETDMSGSTTSV